METPRIDLAYRMLGIRGNHAEEFLKANIVAKAIRLAENGAMRESMSFPPFRFPNLASQEWEDSDVYEYFSEAKLLFVTAPCSQIRLSIAQRHHPRERGAGRQPAA